MRISIQLGLCILQIVLIIMLLVPVVSNAWIPFYVVQSGSMLPLYDIGDIILVRNYHPAQWQGRVIVFFDHVAGKILVHRVIGTDGDFFVTQGDNNLLPDNYEPSRGDVLGIVYLKLNDYISWDRRN